MRLEVIREAQRSWQKKDVFQKKNYTCPFLHNISHCRSPLSEQKEVHEILKNKNKNVIIPDSTVF